MKSSLPAVLVACMSLTACGVFEPRFGSKPDSLTTAGGCYSPTQNLDTAYTNGAVGCACTNEADVCVADSTGRHVALTCLSGQWRAVEDGVCQPEPRPTCYSPTMNLETAYSGGVGCPCSTEPDACVADSTGRRVALTCLSGQWRAVEDGVCQPEPRPTCYSPTMNLETAYTGGVGCPCSTEPDACVADSTGRHVALTCISGQWRAVEDGVCRPDPH